MSQIRNISSINNDDDDLDYDTFSKFLQEEANRTKSRTVNTIKEMGDTFLTEVEEKKQLQNKEKKKYIPYILKHSKHQKYNNLMSYELSDIKEMYDELKKKNQSFVVKFIKFLIN